MVSFACSMLDLRLREHNPSLPEETDAEDLRGSD
jgi:hypothetical protein